MALVLTLALVVLVTIAAMAFFTRATANRSIESSRTNEVLAAQLARSACDYIAGQFLEEISSGSASTTVEGITIFHPLSAVNAAAGRRLAQSQMLADPIFANLVRQSAPGADPNASGELSTEPAANGRSVPLATWNSPMLTVGGNFSENSTAPTWVYIHKNGTLSANGSNTTIGRFAYNAYDTGGLLDANVAGYPTSINPADLVAIKGTLAAADLSVLGIPNAAIDKLVEFRNPGYTDSAAYRGYIDAARKTGFLSANITTSANASTPTNFFASRQDLIRFTQSRNPGLLDALPYLTHFSREWNAPSFAPSTPAGSSIDYAAESDSPDAENRNIPNVRVKNSFTRLDGSTANPGEPLLKKRFPLSRLTWLEDANLGTGAFEQPAALNADLTSINRLRLSRGQAALTPPELIQKTFGLRWNAGESRWDYCGSTGTSTREGIATLEQVANENREPDFFELLKAGILAGSLGLQTPSGRQTSDVVQMSKDFQILRIGTSAIDQVKADMYPTRIAIDAAGIDWVASGVQRLPYISRWTQVPIRNTNATDNSTLTPADYQFALVIVPVLFNPFQGPDLANSNDASLLPLPANRPEVRIKIEGTVMSWNGWNANIATQTIPPTTLDLSPGGRDDPTAFGQDSYLTISDAPAPASGAGPYSGQGWEQFMNSPTWNSGYIQNANPNTANTGRGQPVGYRLPPRSPIPADPANPGGIPLIYAWYGGNGGNANPFQISMEFRAPNGRWYSYSTAAGLAEDESTWPAGLYARPGDLMGGKWGNGANWEAVPVPEWRNMVPYSYSGSGGVWTGGNPPNYASAEFDMVANFCQVITKADPRSIRFNTVGSNNLNLRGLSNGGRLTRGLWNMEPVGYRNDVVEYTQVQLPGPRARAAADGGFAVNESIQNPLFDSTPRFLKNLPWPPDGNIQPNSFYPAFLCRNNRPNNTSAGPNGAMHASYVDPDGVRRIADCGLYPDPAFDASPATQGNPYLPGTPAGNNPDRPIVLNRPFRSVAELGYVFRDQPFKTLDFFSANSADAALLDLFCVEETEADIRAGVVSLNSKNPRVAQALISGATKREQRVNLPTVSSSAAGAIATNLANRVASTPMRNKSELPSFIESQAGTASLGYGKAPLESIARSLADSTQTRTWNFFFHVVAQSGRIGPNGKFLVEGEKSLWNSVAIDRPLAKIIDRQYEPAPSN